MHGKYLRNQQYLKLCFEVCESNLEQGFSNNKTFFSSVELVIYKCLGLLARA